MSIAPKTRQAQPDGESTNPPDEPEAPRAVADDDGRPSTREAIRAIVERYRETFERLGR